MLHHQIKSRHRRAVAEFTSGLVDPLEARILLSQIITPDQPNDFPIGIPLATAYTDAQEHAQSIAASLAFSPAGPVTVAAGHTLTVMTDSGVALEVFCSAAASYVTVDGSVQQVTFTTQAFDSLIATPDAGPGVDVGPGPHTIIFTILATNLTEGQVEQNDGTGNPIPDTYSGPWVAVGGVASQAPFNGSLPFAITSNNHLAFIQQPSAVVAGAAIMPSISVAVENANNKILTSDTGSVLEVGYDSGGGPFNPIQASATMTAGVATFTDDVSVDFPGTRELCVSTGGFGGMEGQPLGMFVVSNPFDVSDFASLTNGVLSVQGTDNADAVTVQDSSGNVTAIVGGISSQVFNGVTGIRIHGGGGAETISVQGIPIPATIHGGGGNVTITGGAGDDSIKGGAGNCSIIGGTGNDSIKGGAGNDSIRGGSGNVSIVGGEGNDSIRGGAGNDTIDAGGSGNDTLRAGSGNSSIAGGTGDDSIRGGSGRNTLQAGSGNDSILGGSGDDVIRGGAGNDTLDGGGGTNKIHGGAGITTFMAVNGTGDEIFVGSAANDILDYSTADSPIIETGSISPQNMILVS